MLEPFIVAEDAGIVVERIARPSVAVGIGRRVVHLAAIVNRREW
jgi:hypothetical protein